MEVKPPSEQEAFLGRSGTSQRTSSSSILTSGIMVWYRTSCCGPEESLHPNPNPNTPADRHRRLLPSLLLLLTLTLMLVLLCVADQGEVKSEPRPVGGIFSRIQGNWFTPPDVGLMMSQADVPEAAALEGSRSGTDRNFLPFQGKLWAG